MKFLITLVFLLGLSGLAAATLVKLDGFNDVSFDAAELEALSAEMDTPELNLKHRRSLKAEYVGCKYYPDKMYTGDAYQIHSISIYYQNATAAQEACCSLCYYVKNCRKQNVSKSVLSLVGGGNEIAGCTMYTKKAKRVDPPAVGGFNLIVYSAGVLIT